MVLQGQRFVVVRGDAGAVILNFNGIKTLILESYICVNCVRRFLLRSLLGHTYACRSCIETVLHQLLHNRAQIDNNLARLDLMNLQMISDESNPFEMASTYRPALYGLDGGHGMVAWLGNAVDATI
jgi:DNA-directed RNA polymerase subunit RPC12/RpoP